MSNQQDLQECGNSRVSLWVGCDVSKETFDAALCLTSPEGCIQSLSRYPTSQFPRSEDGVRKFLGWLDFKIPAATEVRVVMESTGRYSRQLTLWMTAQRPSLAPAIVNPEATAAYVRSLSLRNKTDQVEARALARFGAERQPQAYIEPSPEYAELRELARYRQDVVGMRLAEEARMKEGSTSKTVLKQLSNHIRHLQREEEKLEKAMQELVNRSEGLKKDTELLDSIDGVGVIVATVILSELGDLRRFKSGRQLTAFAGLSPRRYESGTSVHRRTRMCKKGSPRVRQMLYLSAMAAIKKESDLQQCYLRLVAAGKEKMSALGAVMRKMLVLMRSMLISGKPYQRHYQKGGKTCENPVDAFRENTK